MKNIAFEVKYPNPPYLIELPKQFIQHANILKKLGVVQKFSSNYLIEKLTEIYTKNKDIPVDLVTIELCVSIVKEIDSVCDLKTLRQQIYLPDQSMILRRSTELCFQDESQSWLRSTKHHIIHDKSFFPST